MEVEVIRVRLRVYVPVVIQTYVISTPVLKVLSPSKKTSVRSEDECHGRTTRRHLQFIRFLLYGKITPPYIDLPQTHEEAHPSPVMPPKRLLRRL